jgi:hypothetical protein
VDTPKKIKDNASRTCSRNRTRGQNCLKGTKTNRKSIKAANKSWHSTLQFGGAFSWSDGLPPLDKGRITFAIRQGQPMHAARVTNIEAVVATVTSIGHKH